MAPLSWRDVQFADVGRESRSFLVKGNPSASGSVEFSGLATRHQLRGQAVDSLDRPGGDPAFP
jgi:hypothetical protein